MVFTLASGKSIVVTMNEEQAFSIYEQWVNFIPKEKVDVSKIKIEKKKDNSIIEAVSILLSEISAIQMVETDFSK
jgi:hypothetical protein